MRKLAVIALPLAGAYLAELAKFTIDIAIVGRLGSLELAAVGLSAEIFFELTFVSMGVVSIVGVLVSQADEKGDLARAGNATRQGLWVALALSVVGIALGWNLAPLIAMTGQDSRVVALSGQYLQTVTWSFLPFLLFTVLRDFVAALSRARSVTVITVSAVGLNAFMTYALVYGAFGFPEMGVAGAGLSTTIVSWLMFAALAWYVSFDTGFARYEVLKSLNKIDWLVCREIFVLGIPVAGIVFIESGLFIILPIAMGLMGADILAASEIAFICIAGAGVITMAFGEATMIRVAHENEAGRPLGVDRAAFLGMTVGGAILAIGGLVLVIFPQWIVSVFLDSSDPNNAEVIRLASTFLVFAAVYQFFQGLQDIAQRALRAIKDTLTPLWMGALCIWMLALPLAYVLAFPIELGAIGIFLGITLGYFILTVLLTGRFRRLAAAMRTPIAGVQPD